MWFYPVLSDSPSFFKSVSQSVSFPLDLSAQLKLNKHFDGAVCTTLAARLHLNIWYVYVHMRTITNYKCAFGRSPKLHSALSRPSLTSRQSPTCPFPQWAKRRVYSTDVTSLALAVDVQRRSGSEPSRAERNETAEISSCDGGGRAEATLSRGTRWRFQPKTCRRWPYLR